MVKDLICAFDDKEKGRWAFVHLVYQLDNGSEIWAKRGWVSGETSEQRNQARVSSQYPGVLTLFLGCDVVSRFTISGNHQTADGCHFQDHDDVVESESQCSFSYSQSSNQPWANAH
ncbi:hypothetical protein ACFX15_034392 [Malus domestica]